MKDRISDEEMVKQPSNWPAWPFLPLCHRTNPNSTGFLVADGTLTIRLENIFALHNMTIEQRKNIKTVTYDSIGDLLKEWRID